MTATDRFGCTTTCRANLTVVQAPSCVISPSTVTNLPGTSQTFTITVTLGTGQNASDLRTTVTCSDGATAGPFTGVGPHTFSVTTPAPGQCVTCTATVTDVSLPGSACTSTCQARVCGQVVPRIEVFKQVVCYTNGVCEPFSANLNTQKSATGVRINPPSPVNCPAFCYRITVTNAGNVPLNLTVSDNSTPDPDLNLAACGFPAVLSVGASASCVIPAVTHCENTVNVVTANGATDSGTTVTARDTNTVTVLPVSLVCELQVSTNGGATFVTPPVGTNTCASQLVGQGYIVRVKVTNTGQHSLQNVTVTSVLGGCPAAPVNLGNLAIGEMKTTDCPFTCTQVGTNNFAVSVVGEASQSPLGVCDFNVQGQRIVARSECQTCVICTGAPDIEVLKEVACLLPGDTCGTFAKVATGVRDSACPAFCYRIRISNVGPVPITALTVTDPVLGGNIGSLFGPLPIAPGDSRTAIIKPIVHCVDTPDTVTAEGRSADGQVDVDQDSADVRVLNINVLCQLTVSPSQLTNSGPVQVSLILRNTGTSPLRVTAVNGLPALVDCQSGAPIPVTLPINIGPGGSVNIAGCAQVQCPGGTNFTVTANAEADDQNGTLCVNNQNGVRITDSTSCTAAVACAGCCVFLLIDEDCIDNTTPGYSLPPNTGHKDDFERRGKTFTDRDVNDDRPRLAQRAPLRFFNNPTNFGRVIILRSGQISDEGLFALKEYPDSWNTAGPTTNGLLNFRGEPCEPFPHGVGPGLGTGNDPEIYLDKIPRVTPLRATALSMLVGELICALVWDSDISINYKPLNGNLQGEKLGVVAFRLLEVKQAIGFSSSTLPLLTIEIVDPCEAFNCVPSLFVDAPEPEDSSHPFDIIPPVTQPVVALRITDAVCQLSCGTEANKAYKVQYTDSLSNAEWKDLTNFVGTGSIVTVTDSGGPAQRFYRLVVAE